MEKRLRLLEDSWRSGKLSFPVKRRMEVLARGKVSHCMCLSYCLPVWPPVCLSELQTGNWSSADEVHRSLMVDHVTEVSQWMVGVKRLIAEVQNLSPELLETLKNPTGPDQDSGEPAPDPSPLSWLSFSKQWLWVQTQICNLVLGRFWCTTVYSGDQIVDTKMP